MGVLPLVLLLPLPSRPLPFDLDLMTGVVSSPSPSSSLRLFGLSPPTSEPTGAGRLSLMIPIEEVDGPGFGPEGGWSRPVDFVLATETRGDELGGKNASTSSSLPSPAAESELTPLPRGLG